MPASPDTPVGVEHADVEAELRRLIPARRLAWYAIARALVRDPQLAEDCLQDALLLAWRSSSQVRDPRALDPWVRQILVRRCKRARRLPPAPLAATGAATAVEDVAIDRWAGAAAIALIEALPPRQRRAVFGRLIHDLPYPAVAAELGCSEATARSLVRFGLAQVRPKLRDAVA